MWFIIGQPLSSIRACYDKDEMWTKLQPNWLGILRFHPLQGHHGSSDAQLEIIRQIYCSFGDYQQEI